MVSFISEQSLPSNPYSDRIKLLRGDITKQDTDAIATILPQDLSYGGLLNAAILEAAGKQLDEFVLENIYQPRPGDIYAVPGFSLPCKHIFFNILPQWRSDFDMQDRHLLIAVRRSMELTRSMCLSSISIPPLAAGRDGYPPQKAVRLIVQGILERLDDTFREVRIVCRSEKTMELFTERLRLHGWKG